MTEKDVMKQILELDWNLKEEKQSKAIASLLNIPEEFVGMLIQDYLKSTWENAVKVISLLGYPKNEKALPSLLALFQDINWPGVEGAFEVLKQIKKETVVLYLEGSLKQAKNEKDFIWIAGLKDVVEGLNISSTDFNDSRVYDILDLAEW
ncbi:hypothetical protein [Bacillus sp. REN10]|uniref:hypothetical protein n=1 Tax=Bacillus sp. REN10 TaxID=2782541 RepID=UPI00193AE532|nr:hypothetical protein [Bacillus sp. REN10]